MKRKASVSHDETMVRRLRKDPDFAAQYLKAALEDEGEPRVLLIALRHLRVEENAVCFRCSLALSAVSSFVRV